MDGRTTTWSYGGGVQTIAILVLIAQGRLPKPALAVMADTGRERSSTWRYLEQHALPLMTDLGIEFHRVSHDLAEVDLYSNKGEELMPLFTRTGKLRTWCSNEWKKRVVRRHLRSLGYGPKNPAVEWLGISLDEIHRMKHSDVDWIQTHWPLCFDVPLRRVECEKLIEDYGLPIPSKSACWMCPHLQDEQWMEMREQDPADFERAVALDEELRQANVQGGVWLHSSRIPLVDVEFKEVESLPLFECANSCWT